MRWRKVRSGGTLVLASVLNTAPEEASERFQNKGAAPGGAHGLGSGSLFRGTLGMETCPMVHSKDVPSIFSIILW